MTKKDFILKNLSTSNIQNGSFSWQSPSNIALVKYWGKSEPQIPKNTSISFTLNNCHTTTTLEYSKKKIPTKDYSIQVIFEGEINEGFKPKIIQFFKRIEKYVPFITEFDFVIKTKNSFPHSSGIASSASGLSALALCLMHLEKLIDPLNLDEYYIKKASFLARLGSGSAARSVEGPLVVWGKHKKIKDSSDLYGVKFPYKVHKNFKNYQDTILLVDKGEKQVSSTVGHQLMIDHPFAKKRFEQANENISKLSDILQNGDLTAFINLVESEALTLHAMMMTSNPYFILMKANTLKIIEKIWEYRKNTASNICFTLDAGANVHILFPEREKEAINTFITNELLVFCQNNQYICDYVGFGAMNLE
ncbi:MAG: diphosphomevalonate decarboxylase [Flavobacteriaceae bacterium]|nr:diphosphomevalonate decarboxylase [Flavobacteriaceae bacterium]